MLAWVDDLGSAGAVKEVSHPVLRRLTSTECQENGRGARIGECGRWGRATAAGGVNANPRQCAAVEVESRSDVCAVELCVERAHSAEGDSSSSK